jgi:DNA-binding NtrC family response regulator
MANTDMISKADVLKLEQGAHERGNPYQVLIVDDERWVREVLRDFCKLTDAIEVDLAENGVEAVEKLKRRSYDLITMDLIMPEMSGVDALTAIKQVAPTTKVIVITGNATDKLIQSAGVEGACRLLHKPVRLDDFVAEITSTLIV